MRDHVKILSVLNIIMGCLGALAGIVVLIVFGGLAGLAGVSAGPWSNDNSGAMAAPILVIIGLCIAVFVLLLALPCIIGGWGLLKFKPWARVLMIVVSVFHLFHIPIGTALGVYGLWVLLHDETRRLFESGGQPYLQAGAYPTPVTYPHPPSYPPQPPPGV
ncbi:MAG: hypothetical protein ACR2IV_22280 [Bryobacteraceae bacterium]